MLSNLKYCVVAFFITFLLFQYYYKEYKDKCDAEDTKFNNDISEIPYGIDFKTIPPESIHQVFWTGGFDSTFRICQLLLLEDKPVQPIYIMCGNVDGSIMNRQNTNLEIIKMKEIRDLILKNNTHLVNKFLPTHYVTQIKKNNKVTKKFNEIHQKLGYFSRDINQYERMARYSLEYPYTIEVGLENCGTGLDEATKKFRIGYGQDCKIDSNLTPRYSNLDIFKNLRFPIVHLTKDEMKEISIRNNFYHILKNSWSCWFPINGMPCGKCNMCKERII